MKKHPNFGPVTTPLELIDAALVRARAAELEERERGRQAEIERLKMSAAERRRRVVHTLEELKRRNREMARR